MVIKQLRNCYGAWWLTMVQNRLQWFTKMMICFDDTTGPIPKVKAVMWLEWLVHTGTCVVCRRPKRYNKLSGVGTPTIFFGLIFEHKQMLSAEWPFSQASIKGRLPRLPHEKQLINVRNKAKMSALALGGITLWHQVWKRHGGMNQAVCISMAACRTPIKTHTSLTIYQPFLVNRCQSSIGYQALLINQ